MDCIQGVRSRPSRLQVPMMYWMYMVAWKKQINTATCAACIH